MLKDLKQFVPTEVCLKCDGCCRFKEETSVWRPKVVAGEKLEGGLAEEIFSRNLIDQSGRVKTVSCHGGGYQCSFFQAEGNTCGIYRQRPFECQLYPFVLTKENNQPVIAVHLHCPFIQETRNTPEFDRYVQYLQEFFSRSEVTDFVRKNPALVSDYQQYRQELECMFTVNLGS